MLTEWYHNVYLEGIIACFDTGESVYFSNVIYVIGLNTHLITL